MKMFALKIGEYDITAPDRVPQGGKGMFEEALGVGINILFIIAILLCLLYLIWGGIDWSRSEGDKQKVDSAKKRVTYAIVGLVIVFLAFFIIRLVGGVFGISNLV